MPWIRTLGMACGLRTRPQASTTSKQSGIQGVGVWDLGREREREGERERERERFFYREV